MKQSELPAEEDEEEEEEESNQFNRLPDEILLLIFKLLDLKFLCLCSLVSKRFASIVPNVPAVSFAVPRRRSNSWLNVNHDPVSQHTDNFPKKLFRFLVNDVVSKPLRFIRQIAGPKPLPSSLSAFYGDSFRSSVCFLSKFREIRDLQIELPSSSSDGGDRSSTVIKWRAKFATKLQTFVFLSSTSIRESNRFSGRKHGEHEDLESATIGDLLKYRVQLAFRCLKDALVRHRMLLFLIEQHPMLRSVAIADSKKEGLLSVSDDRLIALRNRMGMSPATLGSQLRSIEVPSTARQWYVPVLELPKSGYVMEGATLVEMGMVNSDGAGGGGGGGGDDNGGNGDEDDEDDDEDGGMVMGSFENGEEAFGEAVKEMMVNHMNKMKTLL